MVFEKIHLCLVVNTLEELQVDSFFKVFVLGLKFGDLCVFVFLCLKFIYLMISLL